MSRNSRPARSMVSLDALASDTVPLSPPMKSIKVTVAGNVVVTDMAGAKHTYPVEVGYHPISIKQLWSTSTTATGVWGFPE